MKYLCHQNDKANSWHDTQTIDLTTSCFLGESNLSSPSVFGIFYKCCQQLKQPVDVSYRTVELYERFSRSYFCQTFRPEIAVNKAEIVTAPKKICFQEIHTEWTAGAFPKVLTYTVRRNMNDELMDLKATIIQRNKEKRHQSTCNLLQDMLNNP